MPNVTVVRTSVQPPYSAHLRVYEPLSAWPEPERSHWRAYAAERGPDAEDREPVAGAALAEQREALAELLARTPRALPEQESGQAFVRLLEGTLYVCPRTTRLRSWQALEELHRELPAHLLDTVLPPAVRAAAEADRQAWWADHPDARPWILSSRWEVPVGWFLPFGEEDRQYVPQGEGEPPTAPALFYLTPMVQARRRVARGYRVLKEQVPRGPLVRGAERVGRWLEEFHPRSLVELDYGGLVHLLGDRLAGERSVAELADGLGALRAGDGAAALRAYESLTGRWRKLLALRQAS
ncbi:hypothetical protein [Kitasatospora terrestris]|uniref:hypothetical protein n=1 Tax=Kitasatospora terrestris TaxID=258051 RepID=UPI0031F1B2CC